MIEAEWWDYDSVDELADAVSGDVGFIIESALDARGEALIALPGGKTPLPIFAKLAQAKLNWKKVTIIPTDERLVPLTDENSNIRAIAQAFLPSGARVSRSAATLPTTGSRAIRPTPSSPTSNSRSTLHGSGLAPTAIPPRFSPGPISRRRSMRPRPSRGRRDARSAAGRRSRAARHPDPFGDPVGADRADHRHRRCEEGAAGRGDRGRPVVELPIGRVLAEAEQPIDIHWCP